MTRDADICLVRLLQLASPALPVGAFSYSQGLEAALQAGVIRDAMTTQEWIRDVLVYSVARAEAPLLLRLIDCWRAGDYKAVAQWNDLFLASRDTAELRAETVQMGYSMRKLVLELGSWEAGAAANLKLLATVAFPAAYAFAAAQWQVPAPQAALAYLWAWLENQVLAAIKAVPLGQTDGQRMLFTLGARLVELVDYAAGVADDEIGSFAPALALMSSRHETQYSRLFRS